MLFLTALLLVIVLSNSVASVIVANQSDIDRPQKIAQIIVIWILPPLFALGVIWLYFKQKKAKPKPAASPALNNSVMDNPQA